MSRPAPAANQRRVPLDVTRAALLLIALTLAGCAQSSTSTAPSPRPQTGCRLAVQQFDLAGNNTADGFIHIPGGKTIEPAPGASGRIYDAAIGRWINGDWGGLSPDGLSYAFTDGDTNQSRVHITDLRSGTDRVVTTGGPWAVVGLQPDGVYLRKIVYGPDTAAFGRLSTSAGLWFQALRGGAPEQLTSDSRSWLFIHAGFAWGIELNKADPRPLGGDGGYSPNQVMRLDLVDRSSEPWLYRPGMGVDILGLDGTGAPFVVAQNGAHVELWRLYSANVAEAVWRGNWGDVAPAGPMVADGDSVWLSSFIPAPPYNPAIYRWTGFSGIHLVAQFSDRRVMVAGPCM